DQTAKKEDILLTIEKKYANSSFETQFEQTTRLEALDITDKAFGMALFSYPGKMRWEYQSPESILFITNGKTLWMFHTKLNQVQLGDAALFLQSGAGGAFLSDIAMIRKNFDIRIKQETNEHTWLDLTSKKVNANISSIQIQISKKTHEIVQVVTHSPFTDETTRIKFTNTRFKNINPEVYEFKIPDDAIIIKDGLN
ncbi:MAG: outer membrane lipoprotein carrier protein LolA, partial [Desulfobacula sp.]|nr:outer membrane lipoprotein carrier protein LolA [Desulfobacula sp.]